MRKRCCYIGFVLVVLLSACATSKADDFTPLLVSPLTANARPVLGADGRMHIVYELVLTNANPTPATLRKIEVIDGSSSKVFASYEGQQLLSHLRTTARVPPEGPEIEFNGTRLVLIDLSLDASTALPGRLLHHIELRGGGTPSPQPTTPVPLSYTVAPLELLRKLPHIGPPLSGKGWVALNGCCAPGAAHRSGSLSVNGKIYFAQRFAIDWMQLDNAGRLVHDDASDVRNYPGYGADVNAVADGTVVETLNDLEDQKPPTLPDPQTITLQNVDGNHVVLDLGDGVFAFYAHLQKSSVRVASGDRVKRGQLLAKLGNTGNTSGPHLHFHLMEGSSVLGSNGIPYVMDSFAFAGQVPAKEFAAATGVEGDYGKGLASTPSPRHGQFPLDLDIVNFSSTK
jgi:hypothetical protein